MNDPSAVRTGSYSAGTSHVGPLGSTVHVLHADADTIADLAAIDWSRHFSRVCLDPVRGLITLMSPSFPHEDLATILDDVVDAAGSLIAGATKGLRSTRLRGRDEPPGTGMEPDCAFYVGARAKAYYAARDEGKAAVNAYVERVAPDLVIVVRSSWGWEGDIRVTIPRTGSRHTRRKYRLQSMAASSVTVAASA